MTDAKAALQRRADVHYGRRPLRRTCQSIVYVPSDVDRDFYVLARRVAVVMAHAGVVGALVVVHGPRPGERAVHVEIDDSHRPARFLPLVQAAFETAGARHGTFHVLTTRER
jgi:hypothetical protein